MDKVAIPTEAGWFELVPGRAFVDRNGRGCPADWIEHASPEEIAAIGGKTIIEPPSSAPEGRVIVIMEGLADIAGNPARRYDVVDAPAPVVPVPEKPSAMELISVITTRLDADGNTVKFDGRLSAGFSEGMEPGTGYLMFTDQLPEGFSLEITAGGLNADYGDALPGEPGDPTVIPVTLQDTAGVLTRPSCNIVVKVYA